MSNYVVMPMTDWQDALEAVREKNESTQAYRSGEVADAIRAIKGGAIRNEVFWGDGSDGDLTVASGETYNAEATLDEGQFIARYNDLTIEEGGIWQLANRMNGGIVLVKGDMVVNGTMHADKCSPEINDQEEACAQELHVRLCGVYAAGAGGRGGKGVASDTTSGATNKVGNYGAGGAAHRFGGGWGGGGGSAGASYNQTAYGITAGSGTAGTRPPIGTDVPVVASKMEGGKYGTGGRVSATYYTSASTGVTTHYYGGNGPGGGGAIARWTAATNNDTPNMKYAGYAGSSVGGGALFIFVRGSVTIGENGLISANGGSGGAGRRSGSHPVSGGGGGGGGGGIVCLVYGGTITNNGTVEANGGAGGAAATSSYVTGNPGIDGDIGVVKIAHIDELAT